MHFNFSKPSLPLLFSMFFSHSAFCFAPFNIPSNSEMLILSNTASAISKTGEPSVINSPFFEIESADESEKILVVLQDSYGSQNYSKVVITDVDMELSILIAKDLFNKLPGGIYTVVASSANDLISQKLIIQ